MASGILGGGSLPPYVQATPYTAPAGKVTTATLLVINTSTATTANIQLQPVDFDFNIAVPSNGTFTMSGIILGGGQSMTIKAHSDTLKYMLTGWESTP